MEIWEGLMCIFLTVVSLIHQPMVDGVIQRIVDAICGLVDGVVQRIVDAICGFVSRELGRLWRLISRQKKPQAAPILLDQGRAVVDLRYIEEDLKTKVKEVEAENEMLSKRNEIMEKKVGDLQKMEEKQKIEIKELKTKIKELKKEIKEKIKEELKTKIKGTTGTENKVLREKSEATEIMSKIIGEGWIHRGPWGGNGGAYWTYKVDVAPILQITLGWGSVIDSILIKSKSCDGNIIGNFQRIGGPGGHNFVTFRINNSVERLSSISLTYGHYRGEQTIASLCFYSNLDTYGPFGSVRDPDDPSVSIPIEDDVVLAGFHGRAGNFLNAFGVLVAPKVLNSSHKVHLLSPLLFTLIQLVNQDSQALFLLQK
ncbi:uncharacterized protein LOC131311345 isoform X4 [Rhododendron vialii]|uniref:uncharacterized protein LOC131311345 isoform X4 n=1 Tax=Rhododendron vialii TaxID=182163 RepID=UPI00265E81ED|nr:uncharacterized protein LOC131311345 isoform X4 [Rhododendron vialii]